MSVEGEPQSNNNRRSEGGSNEEEKKLSDENVLGSFNRLGGNRGYSVGESQRRSPWHRSGGNSVSNRLTELVVRQQDVSRNRGNMRPLELVESGYSDNQLMLNFYQHRDDPLSLANEDRLYNETDRLQDF